MGSYRLVCVCKVILPHSAILKSDPVANWSETNTNLLGFFFYPWPTRQRAHRQFNSRGKSGFMEQSHGWKLWWFWLPVATQNTVICLALWVNEPSRNKGNKKKASLVGNKNIWSADRRRWGLWCIAGKPYIITGSRYSLPQRYPCPDKIATYIYTTGLSKYTFHLALTYFSTM